MAERLSLTVKPCYTFSGMKQIKHRIARSRTASLAFTALVLTFVLLVMSQHWMLTRVRSDKREQTYSMLQLVRSTIDLSLDQMFKLSQLLLLDNDIASFMYQREIPNGSSQIQTIIDAKASLPAATTINSMLSEIYLYSNRSGYIVSSQNAFLEPQKMYSGLFSFDALNYGQFRSRYLISPFNRRFFPETTALINGRAERVIPLVQTFPLNIPASNAGKIMLLLDSSEIAALLSTQVEGTNPTVYITDEEGTLITSYGDSSLIPDAHFLDGQHRIDINGEEYILSAITSSHSGLRFFSLLSLRQINAMLSPLWLILAFGVIFMFLLILFLSIFLLARSNRQWNQLLGLAQEGQKPLPYEQAVGKIRSIVEQDRSEVRQAGGTPFITDTFFRRLIHGKMMGTEEIQAMLKQVQADIDLSSPFIFQMMHISINDAHEVLYEERLEDIDFTRIATGKKAREVFAAQHYLYMDYTFSMWILLWHLDASFLERQIDRFWGEFSQVAPGMISMAVSTQKRSLDAVFSAANECLEVQQYLIAEKEEVIMKRYRDLSLTCEPYHYTSDMERTLTQTVLRGDHAALLEILQNIEQDNYVSRTLGAQEHENLMNMLYTTAIKLSRRMRIPLHQSLFTSFDEARQYFLFQGSRVDRARQDKNEILAARITSYIQDHYTQNSLNLSNMAETFGMKESFLYHFMQTRMGTSFAQYLETYRLEQSLSLFSEKQTTITEVSERCGYANAQTFRRAFSKRYGMLPSDYQKTVLFQNDGTP